MKKVVLVGLSCAGLAFAMSGCFVMRTLTFTHDTVKKDGGKTTALISVSAQSENDEYPFFYVISEAGAVPKTGRLDTKGKFSGPVKMKRDDALQTFAADDCQSSIAPKGPTVQERLIATKDPFTAHNAVKFMDAKVPIKMEGNEGDGLAIFMGSWLDDGDGVPEDPDTTDDDYSCQPPYITAIGGKSPPQPKNGSSLLDMLR